MEAGNWDQRSILDIRTTQSPTGVAIIAPCGELDASNADRFRATVQRLQHQVDRVVIDLRGLRFMGVIGCHVLYAAWQLAQKRAVYIDGPRLELARSKKADETKYPVSNIHMFLFSRRITIKSDWRR